MDVKITLRVQVTPPLTLLIQAFKVSSTWVEFNSLILLYKSFFSEWILKWVGFLKYLACYKSSFFLFLFFGLFGFTWLNLWDEIMRTSHFGEPFDFTIRTCWHTI